MCYHLVTFLYIYFTAAECPALAPIPNGSITYGPDTIAPFDLDTVAILIDVMVVSFWVPDLRLERV